MSDMFNITSNIKLWSDDQSLEDHLILWFSQIGGVISLLACLSNLLWGLSLSFGLITFSGFIIYLMFHIQVRNDRRKELMLTIIPVFTIFYVNVLRIVSGGNSVAILYLLVVCYFFVQLILHNLNIHIVEGVAFLNLILLFAFDFFLSFSVGQNPKELAELFDNYIGAFILIFLLLALTRILKKYYSRKLIQAQESDKLKSAFLANLSHEIRTPLNTIIGFSSLLTEEYSIQEKTEFCQKIQDNGNQLCNLMDRLIVISKLESNSIKLVDKDCDVRILYDELYEEYAPRFEQKQIDFDYRLRGLQTVRTDSRMLSLILSELLSNSLKFSRMGRTRFGAVCCHGRCVFFVKDYGIGIRDENQKRVFDSFVKITETSSGLVGGTGIGLSIVKKAVQQLGGEIKMRSTYKKGSVFYFVLPLDNK